MCQNNIISIFISRDFITPCTGVPCTSRTQPLISMILPFTCRISCAIDSDVLDETNAGSPTSTRIRLVILSEELPTCNSNVPGSKNLFP